VEVQVLSPAPLIQVVLLGRLFHIRDKTKVQPLRVIGQNVLMDSRIVVASCT